MSDKLQDLQVVGNHPYLIKKGRRYYKSDSDTKINWTFFKINAASFKREADAIEVMDELIIKHG